jgi:hypothetical protein
MEMSTEVRSVRFTSDDRYIVAVGGDGLPGGVPVATWRWKTTDLLEALAARHVRRMSRDEWTRFLGSAEALVPAAFLTP